MNTNHQIGQNIKRWREFKEIKQEALAKKLSITPAALSNLENGKTDIAVSRIAQIAELLGIDFLLLLSSPQQVINLSNTPGNHHGADNIPHNIIEQHLVDALRKELETKNEQISFLQNLLQAK